MSRLLIITGAGSSKPYGFPSGVELKKEMIELCSNKSNHSSLPSIPDLTNIHHPIYNPLGVSSIELLRFGNALSESDHSSVDAFCFEEASDSYIEIARIVTAYILDQRRNNYLRNKPKDWIEELFKVITEFANNNTLIPGSLSFVTFNYDNVLEDAIINRIEKYKSLNKPSFFESVEVHHIYGKLNQVYANPSVLDLQDMADDIILMKDKRDNNLFKHHEKMKELTTDTFLVMFLGFGFHEENLKMLNMHYGINFYQGLGKPNIIPMVVSTAINFSNAYVNLLNAKIQRSMHINIGDDCIKLIQQYSDSIKNQIRK